MRFLAPKNKKKTKFGRTLPRTTFEQKKPRKNTKLTKCTNPKYHDDFVDRFFTNQAADGSTVEKLSLHLYVPVSFGFLQAVLATRVKV